LYAVDGGKIKFCQQLHPIKCVDLKILIFLKNAKIA